MFPKRERRERDERERETHLADWHIEIEIEEENRARQQRDEDGERRILEISELNLHRAELDAPAHVDAGRRRLEPHRLPIGRLGCRYQMREIASAKNRGFRHYFYMVLET